MAKYEVRVRYAFEGTYMVAAGNREEAKRMVEEDSRHTSNRKS